MTRPKLKAATRGTGSTQWGVYSEARHPSGWRPDIYEADSKRDAREVAALTRDASSRRNVQLVRRTVTPWKAVEK